MNKPKTILYSFEAEDIKQSDITRFKNLLIKLKVKVKVLDYPEQLRGQKAELRIIDDLGVDVIKLGTKLIK